jgi:hypothetical protein
MDRLIILIQVSERINDIRRMCAARRDMLLIKTTNECNQQQQLRPVQIVSPEKLQSSSVPDDQSTILSSSSFPDKPIRSRRIAATATNISPVIKVDYHHVTINRQY